MDMLIQDFSWYSFLWFFLIYGFLGWCTEVAYAAVCDGHFVNRGFLNGPICPIYGFGVVLVIGLLTPLKSSPLALFAGAVVLTSALEWATGFILEKVFHDKWWDYSDLPFNISGYICLKFSVLWGLACILVVDVVHPFLLSLGVHVPKIIGWSLLVFLLGLLAADTIVTVSAILKLNRRMDLIYEVAEKLKETSNAMGENISGEVLDLQEKQEEWKVKAAQLKEQLEEEHREQLEEYKIQMEERRQLLQEHFADLSAHGRFVRRRITKAFPNLTYRSRLEEIERIKELWVEEIQRLEGKGR